MLKVGECIYWGAGWRDLSGEKKIGIIVAVDIKGKSVMVLWNDNSITKILKPLGFDVTKLF